MLNITLNKNTEKRLNDYVSIFKGNYNSMFNEILSYRANQLKKALRIIQSDLHYFEKKYNMTSENFYNLFEKGNLSDENSDFYQWSGEYEMFLNYKNEMKVLK